jgi:nucleoside 2-deoxyribosyltransferase
MNGRTYVAGPVFDREGRVPPVYEAIRERLAATGTEADFPLRDWELDRAEPREFVEAIRNRIERADTVITVLAPGDQSAPVESTMAAFLGKRQIIVSDGAEVPRMLRGLEGVAAVASNDEELSAALDDLGGELRA